MTTRVQELLNEAATAMDLTYRCSVDHVLGKCLICNGVREYARDLARAALFATLRKQHLRLTYFEPDVERRALIDDLRNILDINA